jgi:hypothetical protein
MTANPLTIIFTEDRKSSFIEVAKAIDSSLCRSIFGPDFFEINPRLTVRRCLKIDATTPGKAV